MDYWYRLLILHSCVPDTSHLREPFEERQVVKPEVLYFNQQEPDAEYTHQVHESLQDDIHYFSDYCRALPRQHLLRKGVEQEYRLYWWT